MIAGIGVDIVRIGRIEAALSRFGARFARRVLAPPEWADFEASARPAHFLAKRFAAKEAMGKAIGTGVRDPVTLHGMWLVHGPLGKPSFAFSTAALALLERNGVTRHHVSLSDEDDAAVAMVVLESVDRPGTVS